MDIQVALVADILPFAVAAGQVLVGGALRQQRIQGREGEHQVLMAADTSGGLVAEWGVAELAAFHETCGRSAADSGVERRTCRAAAESTAPCQSTPVAASDVVVGEALGVRVAAAVVQAA